MSFELLSRFNNDYQLDFKELPANSGSHDLYYYVYLLVERMLVGCY